MDDESKSLTRVALGVGNDLDHWRARAVRRREQHAAAAAVSAESARAQLEQVALDVIEQTVMPDLVDLAEDIGADSGKLQKRISELEERMPGAEVLATRREISELGSFLSTLASELLTTVTRMRGELDAMRGERRDDNVTEVPRDAWKARRR